METILMIINIQHIYGVWQNQHINKNNLEIYKLKYKNKIREMSK